MYEVVKEVQEVKPGKWPTIGFAKFIPGEFEDERQAREALLRHCVEFYDETKNYEPYTKLIHTHEAKVYMYHLRGKPCYVTKVYEDGVWQWMIGEDRSYGHGPHNDMFIHIREVAQ